MILKIELAISVILLSMLICYSKDFLIHCIKLKKEVNKYKADNSLNEEVLNDIKNTQFMCIVFGTLALAALIFVFKVFTIFAFPLYFIALVLSWYIPLNTKYKSGEIFAIKELKIKCKINDEDHLIYMSILHPEVKTDVEDDYWNHYLDEIYGINRKVAVVIGDNVKELEDEFKKHEGLDCYSIVDLNAYHEIINWTLVVKYNIRSKSYIRRYFDI